jgi:hypothetical protein
MNLNTLKDFRQEMYDCLLKAKGALFNTVDALSPETTARSLPEVSQSLWFERDWSSIYEAGDRRSAGSRALAPRVYPPHAPARRRRVALDRKRCEWYRPPLLADLC